MTAARRSDRLGRMYGVAALVLLLHPPATALAEAAPFASCVEAITVPSPDPDAAFCFYAVAERERRFDEGIAVVQELRRRAPDNPWLTLALGNLLLPRDEPGAASRYREAADAFRRRHDALGEVIARSNLRHVLHRRGLREEAAAEVERIVRLAERSDDDAVVGRALLLQATDLMETGGNLGEALRALERARERLRGGSYALRRGCLTALGNVAYRLGRFDQALATYRRLLRLAGEQGERTTVATAAFDLANTRLRQLESTPEPDGLAEVETLARRALAAAVEADSRPLEIRSHRLLGDLLRRRHPQEARHHLDRCLELAAALGHPASTVSCLWSLGELLEDQDPDAAAEASRKAVAIAAESGDLRYLTYAWESRMRVAWKTMDDEAAARESLRALDAIETLRALQPEEVASAALFSTWARDYDQLVGRLLGRSPPDLALAFAVGERRRARVLLDALARPSPATAVAADEPLRRAHDTAVATLVAVQRRLLDPSLAATERRVILEQLATAERDELELRQRLRRREGGAVSESPPTATLEEVQEALASDEALLSFQVDLWEDLYGEPGGGSWLIAVTRGSVLAYRLPDRRRLEVVVPLFLGLIARRDSREADAAGRLGGELLAPALDALPDGVAHLVIVPDGVLHRLPWAALRPAAEGEPVSERFRLSVVPSATLWLRWRRSTGSTDRRPALALADPAVSSPKKPGTPAIRRQALLERGLGAAPLPNARREARAMVRDLGGDMWLGADASERRLKAAPLGRYGLLHLAAHAFVDPAEPGRSAVLLAPGADDEDGLLQPREIAALELDGDAVVLSACETLEGTLLEGEGILSLGRAFFRAGARAVVGTHWRIRDDEAAWLFGRFYGHLAEGDGTTLAGALQAAQRDARRAGRPTAAWAGVVLLGDGSSTVRGVAHARSSLFPIVLVIAVAIGTAAALRFGDKLARLRWP